MSFFEAKSQIKEIGFFGGGSYYIGEINRSHYAQQQPAAGIVYKKNFLNKRTSLRLNLMYNQIKAEDFKSGIGSQINRNLDFKNSIIEFGPVLEVNFFEYIPGQDNVEIGGYGTPYFFFGASLIRTNPKAKFRTDYDGDWLALQPLGTEGQETSFNPQKKYSRNQIVIPFGLGVKVNLSHHVCLAFEYGIRKTFTDYIDDVSGLYPDLDLLELERPEAVPFSENHKEEWVNDVDLNDYDYSGLQRGNSADKDWYMVSGIVLTYQFFSDSSCPKWK